MHFGRLSSTSHYGSCTAKLSFRILQAQQWIHNIQKGLSLGLSGRSIVLSLWHENTHVLASIVTATCNNLTTNQCPSSCVAMAAISGHHVILPQITPREYRSWRCASSHLSTIMGVYLLTMERADNVVHGATTTDNQARLHQQLIISVTATYWNTTSVPFDDHSFLFGMPLITCLNQSTSSLQQWLQQYCSGQERLILKLWQERRSLGTIHWFLVACTAGWRPQIPAN